MKRRSFSEDENQELQSLCIQHNGGTQDRIYTDKVIEAAAKDFFISPTNTNQDGEKKHKVSTIKKHIKNVINYHDELKESTFDVSVFEDLKSIHHNNYEEIATRYYQRTGMSFSGAQLRNFDSKRKNLTARPPKIKEEATITTVQQQQIVEVEDMFDCFIIDDEQLVWTLNEN